MRHRNTCPLSLNEVMMKAKKRRQVLNISLIYKTDKHFETAQSEIIDYHLEWRTLRDVNGKWDANPWPMVKSNQESTKEHDLQKVRYSYNPQQYPEIYRRKPVMQFVDRHSEWVASVKLDSKQY